MVFRTYDYKNIAYHKLQPKTLAKLIKRLAKQYRIADSEAAMPNVTKMQIYGQLQFLLRKNYYEQSLSMCSVLTTNPGDNDFNLFVYVSF